MTSQRAEEWAKAIAVVATGAVVGYFVGSSAGFTKTGIALGIVGGMSFNWTRGCPVCHEHMERMRASENSQQV